MLLSVSRSVETSAPKRNLRPTPESLGARGASAQAVDCLGRPVDPRIIGFVLERLGAERSAVLADEHVRPRNQAHLKQNEHLAMGRPLDIAKRRTEATQEWR